jgi:hypothetical protein
MKNSTIEKLDISDVKGVGSKLIQIKKGYSDTDKQLKELYLKQDQFGKSLMEILGAETDIHRRKEIIDFVFSEKVEEVHEYALRKMYL